MSKVQMAKSNTSKVRTITLTTYNERHGDNKAAPLYVLNRTSPRGNVAFTAKDDMGRPSTVMVPATFIPIDLTEQVTKESLLESTFFRRSLNKMQLVILDTESAEQYLATNALAKAERARLNSAGDAVNEDMRSLGSDESEEIDLGGGGGPKRRVQFEDADSLSDNQFINAFVTRAAEDSDETDDNLVREFLNRVSELTSDELELLRAHVTRPKIVELIVQALEDA